MDYVKYITADGVTKQVKDPEAAAASNLAPDYGTLTFPVAVGTKCTNNGVLYRCKTAISAREAFTPAHWEVISVYADLQAHFPDTGKLVAGTGAASANYAAAVGQGTRATQQGAHAEGIGGTASGTASHAEGSSSTASGAASHAEGDGTTASGAASHAEGSSTEARGDCSHTEGNSTIADGEAAHAEGDSTGAKGDASHASGECTVANRKAQFVFGRYNVGEQTSTSLAQQYGDYVEIVGNGDVDARSNARTLDWSGNEELAGDLTINKGKTGEKKIGTELTKKVNRTSVTATKTAYSDDGVVTVDDALDEPAKLTLSLEPKQDLHGYTHPWVGGAGKNLLSDVLYGDASQIVFNGVTLTVNNGKYHLQGTAGTASSTRERFKSKEFIVKAGTYTFSKSADDNVIVVIQKVDASQYYITLAPADTKKTYTFDADTSVVFGINTVENTVYDTDITVQLESGSDATEWEPYSNICPITGFDTVRVQVSGTNLWDGIWESGRINEATGRDQTGDACRGKNYIPVMPETEYFMVSSIGQIRLRCYTKDKVYIGMRDYNGNSPISGNTVFKTPTNCYFIRVASQDNQTSMDSVGVNYPATETAYIPYTGNAVTSLPISASAGSTVYGGTVTVNEDGSGTVVVDRAIKYVEDLADSAFTSVVSSDGVTRFWIYLSSFACYGHTLISDFLKEAEEVNLPPVGCFRTVSTYLRSINCAMPSSLVGTTLESVISYFKTNKNHTDNYFVAFLITPQSYPLTAAQIQTLLGTNHVWTDSGCEFTLDYHTDKYGNIHEVYSAFPEGSIGPDDVVTITDGADGIPVKSLSVMVEPKQDLHGYTHPWVGGAGKNLLKLNYRSSTINGINFVVNADGSVTASGQNTSASDVTYSIANLSYLPAGNYYFGGQISPLGSVSSSYDMIVLDATTNARAKRWDGTASGECIGGTELYQFTKVEGHVMSLLLHVRRAITGVINGVTYWPMICADTETDGTWQPYQNICPISGWDAVNVTRCGKNLFDRNSVLTSKIIDLGNGSVISQNGWSSSALIRCNQSFVLSWDTDSNSFYQVRVAYYDKYQKFISVESVGQSGIYSKVFTPPADTEYVRFSYSTYVSSAAALRNNIRLNLGTADLGYSPYCSTTLPISLSRAGTVYGGTLDVGTGELTVNTAFAQFNGGFQAADNSGKLVFFREQCAPLDCPAVKCNLYEADPNTPASATQSAVSHPKILLSQQITSAGITGTRFMVYDTTFATLDDFNAFLATTPMQVVYTLATPVTYQLSPHELTTLLGTNHIWSDAGQVTVEYRADPKLYIAKHEMSAEDRQDITDIKAHFPATGRFQAGTGTASKNYAVAVGANTTASGAYSHAEGVGGTASGSASHVEGTNTVASAMDAHAEGAGSEATGNNSHAEGAGSTASGIASHAEGSSTSSGDESHAEGSSTTASGTDSHSEGSGTTASGNQSHAEGMNASAAGRYSHAEGLGTTAKNRSQHVFGEFNTEDPSTAAGTAKGTYVEMVGNGTGSARSNARTLDWSGNEVLAGGLTVNKISQVSAQTRTEDGYTIKTIRLEGDELELWRMEEIPGTGILDNTVTLRYSDLFNMLQMLNYYRSITPFTAAEMEQLRNLIAGSGGEVPVEIPTETVGDGEEPASGDGLEEEPAVIP